MKAKQSIPKISLMAYNLNSSAAKQIIPPKVLSNKEFYLTHVNWVKEDLMTVVWSLRNQSDSVIGRCFGGQQWTCDEVTVLMRGKHLANIWITFRSKGSQVFKCFDFEAVICECCGLEWWPQVSDDIRQTRHSDRSLLSNKSFQIRCKSIDFAFPYAWHKSSLELIGTWIEGKVRRVFHNFRWLRCHETYILRPVVTIRLLRSETIDCHWKACLQSED